MRVATLRREYHTRLCDEVVRISDDRKMGGYPNFSDGSNTSSVAIAWSIIDQIGCLPEPGKTSPQTLGDLFEAATKDFLESTFQHLQHLRPGDWLYATGSTAIAGFEQYEHLARLEEIVDRDHELASALGGDYIVKPDIVVSRLPISDAKVNSDEVLVGENTATLTPLRAVNRQPARPILHASISCKWTIRSDRSQNTRTEALNLIRNRKGHLPHIVAVTAEPLPTRLAALALGTGDLDCVYHFALPELAQAIGDLHNQDQLDMLNTLVDGKRLRDISDLPFDLAI